MHMPLKHSTRVAECVTALLVEIRIIADREAKIS